MHTHTHTHTHRQTNRIRPGLSPVSTLGPVQSGTSALTSFIPRNGEKLSKAKRQLVLMNVYKRWCSKLVRVSLKGRCTSTQGSLCVCVCVCVREKVWLSFPAEKKFKSAEWPKIEQNCRKYCCDFLFSNFFFNGLILLKVTFFDYRAGFSDLYMLLKLLNQSAAEKCAARIQKRATSTSMLVTIQSPLSTIPLAQPRLQKQQSWCGNVVGGAFSGLWKLTSQSRLGFLGGGP